MYGQKLRKIRVVMQKRALELCEFVNVNLNLHLFILFYLGDCYTLIIIMKCKLLVVFKITFLSPVVSAASEKDACYTLL